MVAVRVSARVSVLISILIGGEDIFVMDSNTGLRGDSFDDVHICQGRVQW